MFHYVKKSNDICCQKNKLIQTKKPQYGQQTYQRAFTPNQTLPKLNQFLFDINAKFGYNSNFNEYFSYSFCSAYNSKLQQLKENVGSRNIKKRNDNNYKNKNEGVIKIDKSDDDEDNKYNDKIDRNNDSNEENGNENEEDYDDDVIDKIKIQ
ncbi:hypothetical protein C1646_768244 [Rhizophagus diaphanus]|nr:hypothetical protein C1646_768244 [Rhizophagus diaphanus] [Rhizophagus sp. MUCL 43196]